MAPLGAGRGRRAGRGLHRDACGRFPADAGQCRGGDLAAAEAKQREALERLQSVGNPFDVAAARAELARIRSERGDKAEARVLLAQALPPMRSSVLPQQMDRSAAEALAQKLGLR